jgi:hypothetical protein
MKALLTVITAALLLGACSYVDRAIDFTTEYGAKGLANAVEGECRRSMAQRKQAYAVYLAEQVKVGTGKMLPLDCSDDGKPDF